AEANPTSTAQTILYSSTTLQFYWSLGSRLFTTSAHRFAQVDWRGVRTRRASERSTHVRLDHGTEGASFSDFCAANAPRCFKASTRKLSKMTRPSRDSILWSQNDFGRPQSSNDFSIWNWTV